MWPQLFCFFQGVEADKPQGAFTWEEDQKYNGDIGFTVYYTGDSGSGGGGGDFSQCNKLKHKLFKLVDYIIIKQLM